MSSSSTRRHQIRGLAAGLVLGAVLAGTGVAVAAIPAPTGRIDACAGSKGALRVIDKAKGQKCASGEKPLSWSRMTPRGAWAAGTAYAGGDVVTRDGSTYLAKGPSTGKDPVSATSAWTVLAAKGAQGASGPQGPQGAQGPKGDPGPQGAPGGEVTVYTVQTGQISAPSGTDIFNRDVYLPVGTYVVSGTVVVRSYSTQPITVTCNLGSTQLIYRMIGASDGSTEVREYASLAQAVQSVDKGAAQVFRCTRLGGNGSVTITVPQMLLTPVGQAKSAPMYPIP